ncbi:MAG: hypothetical protein N4A49_07140 [Marinifilaceae bacterium]|jgi:hypothetical protein|nr:hypothetical protein [Marinifilaceae bacterium]
MDNNDTSLADNSSSSSSISGSPINSSGTSSAADPNDDAIRRYLDDIREQQDNLQSRIST